MMLWRTVHNFYWRYLVHRADEYWWHEIAPFNGHFNYFDNSRVLMQQPGMLKMTHTTYGTYFTYDVSDSIFIQKLCGCRRKLTTCLCPNRMQWFIGNSGDGVGGIAMFILFELYRFALGSPLNYLFEVIHDHKKTACN